MKKKDRKNSGRVYPILTIPKKIINELNLFINYFYDDWFDYRDGFRNYRDKTKFKSINMKMLDSKDVIRVNRKIKKQLIIRKKRKNGN